MGQFFAVVTFSGEKKYLRGRRHRLRKCWQRTASSSGRSI